MDVGAKPKQGRGLGFPQIDEWGEESEPESSSSNDVGSEKLTLTLSLKTAKALTRRAENKPKRTPPKFIPKVSALD